MNIRRAVSQGILALSILILLPLSVVPGPVFGQQSGTQPLPRAEYYGVFGKLYSGEYKDAARGLQSMSRSAFRDTNGYFLDSVCYWTILGECYYRVGNYAAAVEQYEAALNLYAGLQGWPTRIQQLPGEIREDTSAARRANVAWGVSARASRYGKFDNAMLILMGKSDIENEAAVRGGGVVDFKRMRKIDMAEVMRCVSLAAWRRYMIKGPTCKIDPFTKQLSTSLVGRGGATIPAAWQGVARGMVLGSMEDWTNARSTLINSLHIAGHDHPLTPIALLMLGHIAAHEMNFQEAGQYFLEASIAAAAFEQYDMVEESLHNLAVIHGAQRTGQPLELLGAAGEWARREKADPLQASLMVDAAMIAVDAGDPRTAEAALTRARQAMRGNDIAQSSLQTRWLFGSARTLYGQRDTEGGDKAFGSFLKHAQGTSRWLYQIGLADNAVKNNNITDRESELLYDVLLNEPVEADWLLRPDETMAFLATPHFEPMGRWFEIALERKAEEKAIAIAELVRRQRFYSALPMGGRLLSFRWILEAPDEALGVKGRLQKQEMLIRYPEDKQLMDRDQTLRTELESLPVDPPANSDERLQQKTLLAQLGELSWSREQILRNLALSREPCELAFPRPLSIPEIQQSLQPNQLVLSFLQVGDIYHVMTLGNAHYSIEGAIRARDADKQILNLIRQIGVADKSTIHDADQFVDPAWRVTAREISGMIFQKSDPESYSKIEQLIVVPDGKFWYLPVELLQYGTGDQTENLINRVRIRYAPTMALGIPDERTGRRFQRSAVVARRNFNRDPEETILQGVVDLRSAVPELSEIQSTFQGPSSLIQSTLDRLFVWHDHQDGSSSKGGPLGVSPMQLDQGKPGSTLSDWMLLPWRGVDQFVWSGLSTKIEGNTRVRADGSELFFASMALMASGTRTALLSRWRVGGQSTLDLVREFAVELNRLPADAAWQRSVDLFRQADLDLMAEPRVRPVELEQPLTGDLPFFWSGYMLLDSGWIPESGELPASPVETAGEEAMDAGTPEDDG